jgi:FixJ family two-component response regulator
MTIKNLPVGRTLTVLRGFENGTVSFLSSCATDSHLKKTPVISIIDDDGSVRTAMESLVKSLGFIVCTFASAEKFLQSPHVDETRCLISDVHMPHVSGIDLQSRLLSQGIRMPIIFITAFPDEGVQARALKAGAVAFLSKPVDPQTLLNCLDEALKWHQGGHEKD